MMLYINGIISEKVSYRKSHTGHRFVCIQLPYENSLDGRMFITVNITDVFRNKSRPETHRNIRLGEPTALKTVTICTDLGFGPVYVKNRISNQEIYDAYVSSIKMRTQRAAAYNSASERSC